VRPRGRTHAEPSGVVVAPAQRQIVKPVAALRSPSAGDASSVASAKALIHAACRPIEGRTLGPECADSCGRHRSVKVFTDLDAAGPSV